MIGAGLIGAADDPVPRLAAAGICLCRLPAPRPLPPRRIRVSPRVVKRAISKHRAKGDIDRTNYQATITINIAGSTSGPEP
jgi:hypothetical protein